MLVGQDVSHPCARATNFSTLSTVGTVVHGVFLSNLWPVACQANLELSKARAGAEETSRKLSEQAPPLHMNVIGLGGFLDVFGHDKSCRTFTRNEQIMDL